MRSPYDAAKASPREIAYATRTIEHEGKVLRVDILLPLRGEVKVQYAGVALEVPRLRYSAAQIDSINDWKPY